jgi:hypothetical protein
VDLSVLGSLKAVDWGRVSWEPAEFSGVALRYIRVDREYQHALDEARDRATQFGIVDEREEVVSHWKEAKSWVVPPVVVGAEMLEVAQDLSCWSVTHDWGIYSGFSIERRS